MSEEKNTKLTILGIYPKCPFFKPIPILINLFVIALGTWGIYYLNLWVAIGYLVYSLLFYFLIMPLTTCKYCYFKSKVTITENGKTIEKLIPKEEWSKNILQKHVGQKYWGWLTFLIWILPLVLIIISFFTNFNYLAIVALVVFIIALAGNYLYLLKVKCPTCPIREECHSSF